MINYKKLWEKRAGTGKTWQEVKNELGLSNQTITNINKNEYISLRTLEKFAEYFDCEIGDLVERKKESRK